MDYHDGLALVFKDDTASTDFTASTQRGDL